MDTRTSNAFVSGALGMLDPLLNKLARGLADAVPPESPLRRARAELALGVVKGFVEAFAANTATPIALIVEKVTDFGDFFSGALGVTTQLRSTTVSSWIDSFLKDARERFAHSPDPRAEIEKLLAELELRELLLKRVEGKPHKGVPTELKALLTDGTALLQKFNSSLEKRSRG